jgi:hypothetical protein
MTGWRTIDLMRIRKVHLCSLPGRYNTDSGSYLVVIDANGSRLGLRTTDQAAIRWIHDAIQAATATGVRASRWALISLGIRQREYHRYLPCRDAHPLLYAGATWFVLITIWAGTVALFLQ